NSFVSPAFSEGFPCAPILNKVEQDRVGGPGWFDRLIAPSSTTKNVQHQHQPNDGPGSRGCERTWRGKSRRGGLSSLRPRLPRDGVAPWRQRFLLPGVFDGF